MKPERIQLKKERDGLIRMVVTVTVDFTATAMRSGLEFVGKVLKGVLSLNR